MKIETVCSIIIFVCLTISVVAAYKSIQYSREAEVVFERLQHKGE